MVPEAGLGPSWPLPTPMQTSSAHGLTPCSSATPHSALTCRSPQHPFSCRMSSRPSFQQCPTPTAPLPRRPAS